MAAVVKNIDDIVKRTLAMNELTLHYYVPFLIYALRGLEEMHYDVLQSFKTTTLAIDSAGLVTLPSDFADIITLGVLEGDKVRPLVREDKLYQNSNSGTALPVVTEEDYVTSDDTSPIFDVYYNGRTFERGLAWKDGYTLIRDEGYIRVDNRSGVTSVVLKYLTSPQKVSAKSVIHPYAEQALEDWIQWQHAKHNPMNRFDPQIKRREFYNSLRVLRGRMNGVSIYDLIHSTRKASN